MHRYSVFALTCALIGGLLPMALASPVQEVVPADSFISQHVGSTAQLRQQVTLDPVVRRRLARHFHTSAPAVVRYIQDNLVLKKITVARRYQVYCIGRNGREYTINSRLAVGTPVFVMRTTGKPILKLACGNPMVAALPQVISRVSPYKSPALAAVAKPVPATITPALATHGPVIVAMNDVPAVAVMPTTRVGGFLGQLPVVHGGHIPFGYLAGIPIVASLFHHNGSNSGSTGTTGTTGTTDGTTDTGTPGTTGNNTLGTTDTGTPGTTGNNTLGTTDTGTPGTTGNTGVTPVPEPSTPAAFAVGGLGLLLLLGGTKWRTRRKSH